MNRIAAIFFPCLLCMLLAAGRKPYFRHYGVEEGLSNNRVLCTLQDRFGFLWVGTADGLNRFDGYHFKIFRSTPGEAGSLGDNFISSIQVGPNGALLAGTNTGLYELDYTTEKFRPLIISRYPIGHINVDRKGDIWFVSNRHLKRYNRASGQLFVFSQKQVPQATSVTVAADGSVWASSALGFVYRFDAASHSFFSYDLFAHSPRPSSHRILRLFATSDTSLLVGTTNQGVKRFAIASGTYEDLLTHNEEKSELIVYGFIQNGPAEYWIATETGIYIFNLKTRSYQHLHKGFTNPYSLSDNDVNTLCRDKEGGIWAGTNFGGLNYYPKQYAPFQLFFPGSDEQALSGNVVHEITSDKWGNIWIGTEDAGLNKWNPATGKITYYLPTGTADGLVYTNVHGLVAAENELWVGTFEHGLDVMDIRSGKVLRHYTAGTGPNSLGSNFIVTLYRNRAGEILAGTWNGLYRYRRKTDDFELFNGFTSQVQNITEDAAGTYWICTLGHGVYYFNLRTGKKGHLQFEKGNPNSLSNNTVHGQYHDKRGLIWFSTESGLCRYEPRTGRFRHFTTENGLPGNVVYRVEEDRSRRQLWISTTKGLAQMDLTTGLIRSFTTANGLPSDHFNYNSSFQDAAGKLYFGTLKGMVSFQPAEFLKEEYRPPLFFTQVLVNSNNIKGGYSGPPNTGTLNFVKELVLHHNQSTFSIDFAALSFTAPAMTRYRYKLEGLENAWTLLNGNRRLYFTSLQPGAYRLHLQVLSPAGNAVLAEKMLSISILPPWWARPEAYAFYILLLLACLLLLLRSYHQRTREKARRRIELMALKKEKELYEAKMDFFTNVAHEIRTPLTLIKAPLERILNKTAGMPDIQKSLHTMERNTDRLIELTNQLLDFRKAEANGFYLSFSTIDISELLKENFQAIKPLAEKRGVHAVLKLPAQPLVAAADQEALHKIFSNLLNNAVKYAHRNVLVSAGTDQGHCFFVFENDGPLIPAAMREHIFEPFFRLKAAKGQSGSGVGLALARSLASLHGGTLELIPHPTQNIFELKLPLSLQATPAHNETVKASVNLFP